MNDNQKKVPTKCERCGDPFSMYAKTFGSGVSIPGYCIMRDRLPAIPATFEVQPLGPNENPKGRTTCGTCNRSWDDDVSTGCTPTPAGRCPFEYWHPVEETYICYKCASEDEKEHMRKHGRTALYLTLDRDAMKASSAVATTPSYKVGDWPGMLTIKPMSVRKGKHNIARTRYDVWFVFEGDVWHGVQYGEMTEILHCKRTKRRMA